MKRLIVTVAGALLTVGVAPAQPPVEPHSVVLCEHVDYIGPCRTFKVEPWMRHKLVRSLGDFNDKVSSVRVGSQVSVRLFQHGNFEGAAGQTSKDVPQLDKWKYWKDFLFWIDGDFNDLVSSMIVIPKDRPEAGGGVHLGSRKGNADGQAEEAFFPLPEATSEDVARYPIFSSYIDDEADCLGLLGGATVDVFQNSNLTGPNLRLPGVAPASTKSFPGCSVPGRPFDLGVYQMDEKISSLIVYAKKKSPGFGPNTVLACEHAHYAGACRTYSLRAGMRYALVPTLGNLNDKVSSIQVGEGVSVHTFEHANYGGNTIEYSDREPAITGSWNDRISSLVVAPRGQPLEGAMLYGRYVPQYFFPLPEKLTDGEARFATIDGKLNDESDWLSICGQNVSVTLHQHANFGGDKRDFPGLGAKPRPCEKYRLDAYQFDEVASSLIVRTAAPGPKLVQPHITLPPPKRGDDTGTGTTHKAPPTVPNLSYKAAAPGSVTLEPNSNRPGLDYRDFDLAQAKPELCRDACAQDPRCVAFTYIRPGIQGNAARCWLKDSVPPAEHAPCCVSGIKQ